MLRYAPPIYTVIIKGIIFVIFNILISVFIIVFLPSLTMYPTAGFASDV